MSESIIFYRSFYDAITGSGLDDSDQLAAFRAICEYGLYGTEPKITGLPYGIFVIAKASIDSNARKREGGKKGGRRRNETTGFQTDNHRFQESENTVTGTYTSTITDTATMTGTGTGTGRADDPPAPHNKIVSFSPPSLNEVQQLCREKGYATSPTKFFNYYEGNGWQGVADWKAKLAAWNEDDAKKQVSGLSDSIADYAPNAADLERMQKLRQRLKDGTA